MAASKSRAKRVRKSGGDMVITETAIVIALNDADRRKLKRCLAKSGKITFSVAEHSVTRLPQLLDNGKLID